MLTETQDPNFKVVQRMGASQTERLVQQHPQTADYLREYVERQELESKILEQEITGAVWLLQRTGKAPGSKWEQIGEGLRVSLYK